MPIAQDVQDRLRTILFAKYQLLLNKDADSAEPSAATKSSSNSKEQQHVQRFLEERFRALKRIPGGYSSFDDDQADPGCSFEVDELRNTDPVFYENRSIQPEWVANEDPNNPRIKGLTEQAREVHWRLTAPKGFAPLKGIPELQQLLAYNAADVVHYCAEDDAVGQPGSWRPDASQRSRYDLVEKEHKADCLYDSSSLIGQLAPGLRLCLAAEVATGLMCDSQPPPPDTPEHASALLLFLIAALRQAEQECSPSDTWPPGGSWRLNPSIPNCKTLVDLLACPDPKVVTLGVVGLSEDLENAAGPTHSGSGSRCKVPQPWEVGGNVLVAAWQLAKPSVLAAGSNEQQQQQQAVNQMVQDIAHTLHAFIGGSPQDGPTAAAAAGAGETAAASTNGTAGGAGPHSSSSSSGSSSLSAAEVAWHAAAVAGSAALAPVLSWCLSMSRSDRSSSSGSDSSSSDGSDSSSGGSSSSASSGDSSDEEGGGQPPLTMLAVQMALLLTAVQALHDSLGAVLRAAQQAGGVARDGQQQQGATALSAGRLGQGQREDSAEQAAEVKRQVLTQMLGVVELGRTCLDALQQAAEDQRLQCSKTTGVTSSSRSSSSSSQGLLQQQKHQQQQRQLQASVDCGAVAAVRGFLANVEDLGTELILAEASKEGLRHLSPSQAAVTKTVAAAAVLQSDLMQRLGNSPAVFFQNAFAALGQQQVSPQLLQQQQQQQQGGGSSCQQQQQQQQECLAPSAAVMEALEHLLQRYPAKVQQAAAAEASYTAKRASSGAADVAEQRMEYGRLWAADMRRQFCTWQQQQLERPGGAAAPGSSHPAAAAAAAAADDGDVDQLQRAVSSSAEQWKVFEHLVSGVMHWQAEWATLASVTHHIADLRDQEVVKLRALKYAKYFKDQDQRTAGASEGDHKQQQQQQQQQNAGKQGKKKQKGPGKAAAAAGQGKGRGDGRESQGGDADVASGTLAGRQHSSSKHPDDMDISSNEAEEDAAAAAAAGEGDPEKATEAQEAAELRELARHVKEGCWLCAAEQAAAEALSILSSSSSSSSGGGSPGSSAPAASEASAPGSSLSYSNLPVSWSDPFLMRRLLWDLLGRVKPTAQAWFRTHAHMCPHRTSLEIWQHVTMSIMRHLWAPPGEWSEQQEAQLALLLPANVRMASDDCKRQRIDEAAEGAARAAYARAVNAAFAQQGAGAQVAALLSQQVLLALDPHGARVQPRPELLYYTPAGFHAAVAKTLMQATQVNPGGSLLAAGSSSSAALWGGAGGSLAQQQQQSGEVIPPWRMEQQQQQQEVRQQQLQLHPLQAWSAAALPVWYVWWHTGLLAYQQHQRQRDASSSSSKAAKLHSSSSSSKGGTRAGPLLSDLYSSPDARVFAVGYAARHISCWSQLERLMSNPPVAAGLTIAPADWLAVAPAEVACGQCQKTAHRDQDPMVLCCRCWVWFCCHSCYKANCMQGCSLDGLIQAKSCHRWRVLDLLRPVMAPQQQQQQHKGQQDAASCTVPSLCIPSPSANALPGAFAALLQQHPAHKQPWRQQQQQQQQVLVPLFRLFESPEPWGMCGTQPTHSLQGQRIRQHTEQLVRLLGDRKGPLHLPKISRMSRMMDSDNIAEMIDALDTSGWSKLERCRQEQRTQRQVRLEQQRQQRQQRLADDWHGAMQDLNSPLSMVPRFGGSSSGNCVGNGVGAASSLTTYQRYQQQQRQQQQSPPGYGPHPGRSSSPPAAAAAADMDDIDVDTYFFQGSGSSTDSDASGVAYCSYPKDTGDLSPSPALPSTLLSPRSPLAGLSRPAAAAAAAAGSGGIGLAEDQEGLLQGFEAFLAAAAAAGGGGSDGLSKCFRGDDGGDDESSSTGLLPSPDRGVLLGEREWYRGGAAARAGARPSLQTRYSHRDADESGWSGDGDEVLLPYPDGAGASAAAAANGGGSSGGGERAGRGSPWSANSPAAVDEGLEAEGSGGYLEGDDDVPLSLMRSGSVSHTPAPLAGGGRGRGLGTGKGVLAQQQGGGPTPQAAWGSPGSVSSGVGVGGSPGAASWGVGPQDDGTWAAVD